MTITLGPEILRCVGLPVDAVVEPAGGATGSQWKVHAPDGTFALRVSSSKDEVATELAAMAAARSVGLPVPEVVSRGRTPTQEVVLCTWLRGAPIYDVLRTRPGDAYRFGHLMGVAQRALHRAPAPAALPAVSPPVVDATVTVGGDGAASGDGVGESDRGQAVAGQGDALVGDQPTAPLAAGSVVLHLDFHPYNVLVDDDGISGIVDWVNARAGHPLLDLARTHALLTIEPELRKLPLAARRIVATLAEGWADGYGDAAREIPPICHAWAGAAMLVERASRYAHDPTLLTELRAWTEDWRRRAARHLSSADPW